MPCYSPLKGYKNKEGALTFRKAESMGSKMEVACGQCLGCRLDRSRVWAMRITHEALMHEDNNCFVTLTYDDTHLPLNRSLSVPKRDPITGKQIEQSDFQAFFKRLRKAHPKTTIKYYQCGEYGNRCQHNLDLEKQSCPLCNLGRPHHHACIFNYNPTDQEIYGNSFNTNRYTSPSLEKLWGKGFVDVGNLEFGSAAYVARYILKKITGDLADDHYTQIQLSGEVINLAPEYSSMSNGIGKSWLEKYSEDCYPSDEVPVPGTGTPIIRKNPRYYDDHIGKTNPELLELVKQTRLKHKLENPEEYTSERLMAKYKVKKAQTTNLKRSIK